MTTWRIGPTAPSLRQTEVDVWQVALDAPDPEAPALLSEDEVERAGRFHFERHRRRFTVARAWLRRLLGRYLLIDPAQVQFVYGDSGKPALEGDAGELEFNVSHAHEVAVYGFTRGAPIGIDVEWIREGPSEEGIAKRFFSNAEWRQLDSLPESERRHAFFRCWTRKEAFVKAHGEGLGFGLDQFTVSVAAAEPARLLETGYDPADRHRWSLEAFDPGEGYTGALAVGGRISQVRYYRASREPEETRATGE